MQVEVSRKFSTADKLEICGPGSPLQLGVSKLELFPFKTQLCPTSSDLERLAQPWTLCQT